MNGKFRVVWVGKTKNPHLAAVCEDFAQRIRRFLGFEIVEAREPRVAEEPGRITAEGERILAALAPTDFVVILDAEGRTHTSLSFARFLNSHMTESPRNLVFVIGGYGGLAPKVRKRQDESLSLSRLTYSHDMARAVLLEQIYRGLTIVRNLPYAR